MELRQLRYFVAVAEHGNFTKAATACSVAQPSLSQQILNLEEELGSPLFRRHPRKIELTDAGAAALEHARRILEESKQLQGVVGQHADLVTGTVRIGAIPTVAPYLLPPRIAAFRQTYPGIQIRLLERRTERLLEEMTLGSVDLVLASDLTAADLRRWSVHVRELFHERLSLCLPSGHPLAGRDEPLGLEDFPREELIVLRDGHCLSDHTLTLCRMHRGEELMECDQLETMLGLIGAGMGVGVVPEMALPFLRGESVVTRLLGPPEPQRVINLVRRKSGTIMPAAEAFSNFLTGGKTG